MEDDVTSGVQDPGSMGWMVELHRAEFVEVDRRSKIEGRSTTRVPPEGRVCGLLLEGGGRRQTAVLKENAF